MSNRFCSSNSRSGTLEGNSESDLLHLEFGKFEAIS
jgi:hypothetical protein